MKRDCAKRVLVFNPLKRLVAVYASTFAAAKAFGWNAASMRAACSGGIISYKKLYFRYADDEILDTGGFDTLTLEAYDAMRGVSRKVYKDREMNRRGMKYDKRPKPANPYYPYKAKR